MDKEILKKLDQLISPELNQIILEIAEAGGQSILVGGAVRDLFLDKVSKDIDIEVHKLPLEKLEKVLSKFGPVSHVGKFFGVLRLHGLDVDWSIPRADSSGRKPDVKLDPDMSFEQAFSRRDLTINSMGLDLISKELIDPFGGLKDLEAGVLRATDDKFFKEDPLRFFRVMQFVGRFGFKPDEELNKLCEEVDLSEISKERVEEEFEKLFLKSKKPSLGIKWLRKVGRLQEILPELYDTIVIQQNPKWHPEGDVFEHSMQAMDAAAKQNYQTDDKKLLMVATAMCHDLGKTVSTTVEADGRIRSIGHEDTGVPLAKSLLKRVTNKKDLIKKSQVLVKYHMSPGNYLRNNAADAAYKKLAHKLYKEGGLTMQQLYQLFCSDRLGRNGQLGRPLEGPDEQCELFLDKTKKIGILKEPIPAILTGKDLEDAGIAPGPKMGDLLSKAYEIQLKQNIKDKQKLLKRALGN